MTDKRKPFITSQYQVCMSEFDESEQPTTKVRTYDGTVLATLEIPGELMEHGITFSGSPFNMRMLAVILHLLADSIVLECERVDGMAEEAEQRDVERAREDEAEQFRATR